MKPLLLLSAIACSLALPLRAAPIPTLFNTGVATNNPDGTPGTLTAVGVADAHYTIIGGVGGELSPFVTGTGAYPFPPWELDSATSQWISPQATYAGFLRDRVGTYTYLTTFDLTGFDATTASVSGQVVADNSITSIRVNGHNIKYSQTTSAFSLVPFSLPDDCYVSGVNTIEFNVYNRSNFSGGNPSGLRVELSGTAAASTVRDVGNFTLLFFPPARNSEIPAGTGYATMTVSETGGAAIAGRLADGESFSTTGVLSTGPSAPPQFIISKSLAYPSVTTRGARGLLSGTLTFQSQLSQGAGIISDLNGTLEWTKPAQSRGAYPAAFDANLNVIGSIYVYVTGSSVLPGFPVASGGSDGTLELSDTSTNFVVVDAQMASNNQLLFFDPPKDSENDNYPFDRVL